MRSALERKPGQRTDKPPACTPEVGSEYAGVLDKEGIEPRQARHWQQLERGKTTQGDDGKFTASDSVSDTASEYAQVLELERIEERQARRWQDCEAGP